MLLKEITLKNEKQLSIIIPSEEYAAQMVDYVNLVAGETDFLTFGGNEFPLSVGQEADMLKEMNTEQFNLMLVGIIDGKIVSSLSLVRPKKARRMHAASMGVTVKKEFWGQGIASLMIESMLKWARSTGTISKIELEVSENNTRAIALYRKLGFFHEGRRLKSNNINGHFSDNLLMGLFLD